MWRYLFITVVGLEQTCIQMDYHTYTMGHNDFESSLVISPVLRCGHVNLKLASTNIRASICFHSHFAIRESIKGRRATA